MTNTQLLTSLDTAHQLTNSAILQLRDLTEHEADFTATAIARIKQEVLEKVQLAISEMQVLEAELGGE